MGEEEATMREKLIEGIGDAIAKTWNSTDPEVASLPPIDLIGSERDFLASAALDAALGMLETPSEEMVTEGECWLREYDDRTDFRNDDAARFLKSMLATLRSPKI